MKQMSSMKKLTLPFIAAVLTACSSAATDTKLKSSSTDKAIASAAVPAGSDTAIVAGGCFWCVESDFEKLPGVIEVVSGYSGGDMQNPTYRNHGEHVEVAKIIFDPNTITYSELLDHYWLSIDPTDDGGQFCDRGNAYIPVIYARPDQMEAAENSKAEIKKIKPFSDPIKVPIRAAKTFWDAEDYHQDYYKKNPVRYKLYRNGCGRDKRLQQLWGSN